MGITIAKIKGVVIDLIQQMQDSKLTLSVFQNKAGTKNHLRIITKDMWYKYHP